MYYLEQKEWSLVLKGKIAENYLCNTSLFMKIFLRAVAVTNNLFAYYIMPTNSAGVKMFLYLMNWFYTEPLLINSEASSFWLS